MKKLQTKDLIMAGAFIALYIVVLYVVVTLLGFIVITYLMVPLIMPIVLGPIYYLYVTKIPKQGALLIFGAVATLGLSIGSVWATWLWMIAITIVAELIARSGNYQSKKKYMLSYMVFSLSCMAPFWMLVIAKDTFVDMCEMYYSAEYAATLSALTPPWIVAVFILMCLVGGFIGARFGMNVMKKHFKKAGIV